LIKESQPFFEDKTCKTFLYAARQALVPLHSAVWGIFIIFLKETRYKVGMKENVMYFFSSKK
jgi:hypothetical protein